jgi:hypothetical protein
MKHYGNLPIEFEKGGPAFWIIVCALLVLAAVFILKQYSYMPINNDAAKDFVIDEGRQKAGSVKKYFPEPYPTGDFKRGTYDRH